MIFHFIHADVDLFSVFSREHEGELGHTRSRLPVEMVYQEELPNKSCALQREAAIKKLSREEKLKLIDKGNPLKAVSPDTTT